MWVLWSMFLASVALAVFCLTNDMVFLGIWNIGNSILGAGCLWIYGAFK